MKSSLQPNYICELAEQELCANPEEHSEGRFSSQEEVADLKATESRHRLAKEAFESLEKAPSNELS